MSVIEQIIAGVQQLSKEAAIQVLAIMQELTTEKVDQRLSAGAIADIEDAVRRGIHPVPQLALTQHLG